MSPEIVQLIAWSTLDTLIMVGLSGLMGTLFGLPLGVFLATSRANELFPSPAANRILGLIVNATRSTPFIILVVAIVPLTRLIVGSFSKILTHEFRLRLSRRRAIVSPSDWTPCTSTISTITTAAITSGMKRWYP